jgi:hypothetical protein
VILHDHDYAKKFDVYVKKIENQSERILEGNGNFDLNSVIPSAK